MKTSIVYHLLLGIVFVTVSAIKAEAFSVPQINIRPLGQFAVAKQEASGKYHEAALPDTTTIRSVLWRRMDTLSAAGFSEGEKIPVPALQNEKVLKSATISSIGFLGHTGLFLLSTILVSIVKKVLFPPSGPEPQQAGILNRCPWPFIFFHDVKQGFKDTPTWITLTWIALWQGLKFFSKAKRI